ncbi:cytochrome c oxidase [Bacillus sp. FJAT-27231]|uniref:cytochrome-c oxidase n=1 Tax=Bacillus sp. FJAT-27231 TaxID=1679168 RepID=UPI000670D595|nr:cytochrome-c oxidase [Bacillus sp. FJAT-27231]KMY55581.1 cytochrome c oxidase [Bacillus sp. FJAT-27231]
MAIRLIKISVVYFAIGVLLGYYMSIVHSYELTGVHVHVNLLGWTALMLAGILYHIFPALAYNGIAKAHFWLHNLGLPIMMISLFLLLSTKSSSYTAGVAIGATLTVLGILLFVINVLKNLKSSR